MDTKLTQMEIQGLSLLDERFRTGTPSWIKSNINDDDAPFLAGLVVNTYPTHILEIGVASGFSSAVMLEAANSCPGFTRLSAVDISPSYFVNLDIPTGQAVLEMTPEHLHQYNLITGCQAFEAMDQIGKVDLVFIDANHFHPFTTIDMLSVLPFIKQGSWVALHDISMCLTDTDTHANRGPYYLYNLWPGPRIHSSFHPSGIGAIHLDCKPEYYLDYLLEILYTPWECDIDQETLSKIVRFVGRHFGDEWAGRYEKMFKVSTDRFK